MSLIDNVKDVAELIKKAGDTELYRKIVELQGEIVTLSAEKLRAEQENAELKKRLGLKQAMKFVFPYYYQNGDPNPFCRHCWEAKGVAVHLDPGESWGPGNRRRQCHSCQDVYFDQPLR